MYGSPDLDIAKPAIMMIDLALRPHHPAG